MLTSGKSMINYVINFLIFCLIFRLRILRILSNLKDQLNSVLSWTVSHSMVLLINFIFIWDENTLVWYSSCYDDAMTLATRHHQEWSWIEFELKWPKRLYGDVLKRTRGFHNTQLIGPIKCGSSLGYNIATQLIFWFALDF